MGRLFLGRPARLVEIANGIASLTKQLGALAKDSEQHAYVAALGGGRLSGGGIVVGGELAPLLWHFSAD
jgi:hypothetical protein